MRSNFDVESLQQLSGKPVFDSEHQKIGQVEEIFFDEATRQPEWIGIASGGVFGSKHHVVPVEGARIESDGVVVSFSKEQVKNTPSLSGDEISQDQEATLYQAYGLTYSERPSPSGLPEGRQQGGQQPARGRKKDGDSMTRSEEELRIGKRETDAGRVRLRKWVETQPVSQDVQLRREKATIERTPIDKPMAGDASIGEQELDVELRAEEPVVEKRAVAKEEVRLGKESETQTQRVEEQVRRERIEEERE